MPALANARHERFAQNLSKGMSADEAYREAGFKENRHNASRLKTNETVTVRLQEIMDNISEKAEWTAADRIASLKLIHDNNKTADARVAISAIAEANKMDGSYAPAKLEHTGKDGGPIRVQTLADFYGDSSDGSA